jgi:hypothetical protein
MINYETFCKIHDCHDRQGLTVPQIARALGLHTETVAEYVCIKQYRPRRGVRRASLLDPYKDQIVRWLVRASRQFRVTLDTNRYSVPAQYAGSRVTLKAYPDRILICHESTLIARHVRSYDRRLDIEDPDHPKELLAQRRNAREQRLLMQFLGLSPKAQAYYEGLQQRRLNARHHVRKILALSEIYGIEATARAIEDGLSFHAFSCEYIAHLLESRAWLLPAASPLSLTRRQDLLELELPEPNLSLYGVRTHNDETN